MAPHIRPRPNSIELLPEECEGIVAWAAQELATTPRSQTEIYSEFRHKLIALQGELGLDFEIPHFRSFSRHNVKLAKLTARMRRSQLIADAVVSRTDGENADNVTKAATLTLKTLILEMLESAGEAGFTPKEAANMATAMRSLQIAENLSSDRRRKLEAEFSKKAENVIDKVSKEMGLSSERVAQLRRDFLGVRPEHKTEPETVTTRGSQE
ncbi:DUF3486 family protein [Rhizobium sp. SA279]